MNKNIKRYDTATHRKISQNWHQMRVCLFQKVSQDSNNVKTNIATVKCLID